MNAKEQTLSKVFSVLSNPIRLKIYLLILEGACEKDPNCATSIAEKLKLNQPTVSNHIKELMHANLVVVKKVGKHSYLYGVKKTSSLLYDFATQCHAELVSASQKTTRG